MQKKFPREKLYTTSTEPITIQGDKLALRWPLDTGWEIIPDRKPCEVLCRSLTLHYSVSIRWQISKDMLNDHKAYHYPPKIELDVKKVSNSSIQSTYIEIDIVGITGEKKFILKPKQRPGDPQRMLFVPGYGNSGLGYGTMPPWSQIVSTSYLSPPYNLQYMQQGGYIMCVPCRSHGHLIPQVMFHSLWNPCCLHLPIHSVHHHILQSHTIPLEPVVSLQQQVTHMHSTYHT